MLGNVHAGIGHADNVFRGEAVHRETGHAETAGDVVLAQHGIGRQPQAQSFRQYLRLLDSSFRHQDDEFVSAIARDYVRLPALLLQQPPDAGQHQVAFQMAEVSFTSLNLSRSTSTTENGRPEREARFHSDDSASQKKRRVLMPVRPSVIDCCCSFWNTNELCNAVASKSASVFMTSASSVEKACSCSLSTLSTPSSVSP